MLAACKETHRDLRPLTNTQEGTVPPAKSHVKGPSLDSKITVAPANILLTKAANSGKEQQDDERENYSKQQSCI